MPVPLVTLTTLRLALCSSAMVTLLLVAESAIAVEYRCTFDQKVSRDFVYTEAQLRKEDPSLLIEEDGGAAFVSRCSPAPSQGGRTTCDRYKADRVELDENVKIKKFYFFNSQFDVQLYPDLKVIENNGRGGIAFGRCRLSSP